MPGVRNQGLLLLCLLLNDAHGAGIRKKGKRKAPPSPTSNPTPQPAPSSTFGDEAYHTFTFSVTITPYKQRGAPHT